MHHYDFANEKFTRKDVTNTTTKIRHKVSL